MEEKLRPLNGDRPISPAENLSYVSGIVESSAQSTKTFLVLAHPIRTRIILGIAGILRPVEKKYRGRWCANRVEIGTWRLNTLATFRGNARFDEDEGVEETEEALLLRQLAEGISKKFRIHPSDLFTPIGEVFKRSMSAMESGFDSYAEAQGHREISKTTGKVRQGSVGSSRGVSESGQATNLVRFSYLKEL